MEPISSAHDTVATPPVAHIVSTPGTCGGKPRIAGTRIRVQDIYVWHELQGQSAEEILTHFPHLTLASISAAFAHFRDHRDAIVQAIADGDALVEAFQREHPDKIIVVPPLPC